MNPTHTKEKIEMIAQNANTRHDSAMMFVISLVVVMAALATVIYFGVHDVMPAVHHLMSTLHPRNT